MLLIADPLLVVVVANDYPAAPVRHLADLIAFVDVPLPRGDKSAGEHAEPPDQYVGDRDDEGSHRCFSWRIGPGQNKTHDRAPVGATTSRPRGLLTASCRAFRRSCSPTPSHDTMRRRQDDRSGSTPG